MQINDEIEMARRKMNQYIRKYGIDSTEVLKVSQELDKLIIKYYRELEKA